MRQRYIHTVLTATEMPFQDSCYSKLGGRAYIFRLHYGLTDTIIDPIPVFVKNLQNTKDVLQLWLHNRQL